MTPVPVTIDPDLTVRDALSLMEEKKIRHLPVVADGKLIGLVSQRDLVSATARHLRSLVKIRRVMKHPFAVSGDTAYEDVARQMAEKKLGSALIVDDKGQLVGIFTTVDALDAVND